ncbi:TatD family hydrolase [Shewanella schlegeliana]|uniref:TatD family hydrolase n=1 Tax=Shewanella schlegeliana TaxID=190308 RepID=A0ABS1SYF5_9GAMM|nr:TatD family hydrolase [Shewanella schlegeliana]MBL4913587.1 TatD family hydrolase [Shewanella schlegeliana]MCL1108478.1 TatD family hydrolase [Shewanella schlegeliana]GIU30698.1 hydrolase TatD family protein [Shewanella schlegeliana]
MLPIIDSHAHMDFPEFDNDRDSLFEQMHRVGIKQLLIPAVSPDKWKKQIEIAKQYGCYYSLGIHPWSCEGVTPKDMRNLRALLERHKDDASLVAVGECGLDKLHKGNFVTQIELFRSQISLAKEFDLPLIMHAVKAHDEILKCLKTESPSRKGVVHGFYGGPQLARQYVNLGYKLGIGGQLLNDNAPKLQQTVVDLPLESFVLETDSPSMAPKSSRNNRNTPLILPNIIEKMADLQKKSAVLISEQMFFNVTQLFDL